MAEPMGCADAACLGTLNEIPFEYLMEVSVSAISLKLPGELLEASDRCARALDLTRAEYIRRAIGRSNREIEGAARATRLAEVSRRVRPESMRINAEFGAIERDVDG